MSEINNAQKKIIHVAKAQLKMSDVAYRAMLSQHYEVTTCCDLTYQQAETMIKEMEKMGFKRLGNKKPYRPAWQYAKRRTPAANIIDMASPQLLHKIEMLAKDITWNAHDGYERWLQARFHVKRVATKATAIAVIEGLKAMLARQEENATAVAMCCDEKEPF